MVYVPCCREEESVIHISIHRGERAVFLLAGSVDGVGVDDLGQVCSEDRV